MEEEIIYKDLSYKLNGIFFYVHNNLGSVHHEKQYADAIELKLKADNYKYEREKELFFKMKEGSIGGNRVDFVVEGILPVDAKSKKYITKEDYRQMLRYLKSGNYRLGLIVNFRGPKVTIKRIVNSDLK
jgi:GxxExxY protein